MKEKEPQVGTETGLPDGTEIRGGRVLGPNGEERKVYIVDNGEKFEGTGSIPNHDKVEIIYQKQN